MYSLVLTQLDTSTLAKVSSLAVGATPVVRRNKVHLGLEVKVVALKPRGLHAKKSLVCAYDEVAFAVKYLLYPAIHVVVL